MLHANTLHSTLCSVFRRRPEDEHGVVEDVRAEFVITLGNVRNPTETNEVETGGFD